MGCFASRLAGLGDRFQGFFWTVLDLIDSMAVDTEARWV